VDVFLVRSRVVTTCSIMNEALTHCPAAVFLFESSLCSIALCFICTIRFIRMLHNTDGIIQQFIVEWEQKQLLKFRR
jgi:hypothetical protein